MKNLPSWLPILRNINSGGWLISRKDIQMAMAKPTLYEFTETSPCDKEDRVPISSCVPVHEAQYFLLDKFPQDQFPLTLICAYIIQIFYQ
jgi:hypothetical protein